MKSPKKLFALCLFMVTLVSAVPQRVDACSKTRDCSATGVTVTCGAVRGDEISSHVITEENGYSTVCKITAVHGPHTLNCAGCGAFLGTDNRTCALIHSDPHCYNRYNMCK